MRIRLFGFFMVLSALAASGQTIVGSMGVETFGEHGTPVILIPGLSSGGWVWRDTVSRLKADHAIYVVTLAGFDGRPAIEGKLIDLANESLLELIVSRTIAKPVLIGHSLGGTLSLLFAQKHSDLISGVIAAEGLPVLPGTERMPAAQRPQLAAQMKKQMAGATAEVFAGQQLQYMTEVGVIDAAKAAELARLTARSDPDASAEYMAEDVELDARGGMARITVPVLEIAPFYGPDNEKTGMTEGAKVDYYRSLMKGPGDLEVQAISPARHFVMFDQPKAFDEMVRAFLARVGK
jgi:pimeloyl-ACP methyl ester carboxylesterase